MEVGQDCTGTPTHGDVYQTQNIIIVLSLVFSRKDMFCELLFNVDVAIGLRRGLVPDILEDAIL